MAMGIMAREMGMEEDGTAAFQRGFSAVLYSVFNIASIPFFLYNSDRQNKFHMVWREWTCRLILKRWVERLPYCLYFYWLLTVYPVLPEREKYMQRQNPGLRSGQSYLLGKVLRDLVTLCWKQWEVSKQRGKSQCWKSAQEPCWQRTGRNLLIFPY